MDWSLNKVGELRGHESRVFSCCFSPVDETLLATCSEDNTCRVWDIAHCEQLKILRGHAEAIYAVSWSPDGRSVLTAGSDGEIKIWDWRKGKEIKSLKPKGDVFAASYVDNGNIVSAADNVVSLWDLEAGCIIKERTINAETDYVFGGESRNPDKIPWVFCLERDMQRKGFVLGVSDATIRYLDHDLEERVVLRGHSKDVCCLCMKDDGSELLSGSGDHLTGVWDLRQLQARIVLRGHQNSVHDCCYWPGSNNICSVSMDKTMKIWNGDDGSCLHTDGPGATAKLCIAPCKGLQGVVVGGGENKSLFGQDFRLLLLSSDGEVLQRLQSRAQRRSMEPEVEGNGEKGEEEGEEEIDESLQGMLDELEEKEVLLQAMKLEEEDIEDLSLKERLNMSKSMRGMADSVKGHADEVLRSRFIKLLQSQAQRLLFDIDEDSPKHAQEELERVQSMLGNGNTGS
uniref:Anaphase-promoting complex subunit 4 WD40 domain-containing protein n=1 Tax=Guillardia theta TaxID=55529 RepID=A0A7S4NIX0_GUITH|mmetsp:Transcript_22855/g.74604  ORF Transcript_22855/g.74604 Transcript_22855/m.74604 type:complete len:457 (+) Transcript_22855:41-1411(+)